VSKGQIVEPQGSVHDRLIFNDQSRWAFRLPADVKPLLCETDGCPAQFNCEANLIRHREIVHKPERDERSIARVAEMQARAEAEDAGETIGGREIIKTKKGPRGEVPYIQPYS